ncbi:hypothetical protein QTN25_006019 [Entamoeba marina]
MNRFPLSYVFLIDTSSNPFLDVFGKCFCDVVIDFITVWVAQTQTYFPQYTLLGKRIKKIFTSDKSQLIQQYVNDLFQITMVQDDLFTTFNDFITSFQSEQQQCINYCKDYIFPIEQTPIHYIVISPNFNNTFLSNNNPTQILNYQNSYISIDVLLFQNTEEILLESIERVIHIHSYYEAYKYIFNITSKPFTIKIHVERTTTNEVYEISILPIFTTCGIPKSTKYLLKDISEHINQSLQTNPFHVLISPILSNGKYHLQNDKNESFGFLNVSTNHSELILFPLIINTKTLLNTESDIYQSISSLSKKLQSKDKKPKSNEHNVNKLQLISTILKYNYLELKKYNEKYIMIFHCYLKMNKKILNLTLINYNFYQK